MVRQRKGAPKGDVNADGNSQDEPESDLSHKSTPKPVNAPFSTDPTMKDLSQKTQWLLLAVGSGACAAFNGVFAKLTTTELTTTWAKAISSFLGLQPGNGVVEYGIRGIFFGLNLLFNGIMWALFTAALTKGTSTTQVSIVNVSSNFMITAILGFAIFYEALPPLWWLGATLLVVGNVIIGRREEQETTGSAGEGRIELDERTIVTRVEHELEEERGLLGDMHMKSIDGDIEIGTDIDNPVE